jgi:uncharacterized protein (TIGR03083 family)
VQALRGLDVQGLVGHLIGVERHFSAALGSPGPEAAVDRVSGTDHIARAQSDVSTEQTLSEWRRCAQQSMAMLEALGPSRAGLEGPVSLHGLRMPLSALLFVRTFELWTHDEDIRRATGRSLCEPDEQTLRLLTDRAFELLQVTLARARPENISARVVLTGAGGRTWQNNPGTARTEATRGEELDVRVVMDAVEFCRLVANRADPTALQADVVGRVSAAGVLFSTAASLALD